MTKPLVIFGTAEIASLAKFYFSHDSGRKIAAFTVDDEYAREDSYEGLPVVPFGEMTKKFPSDKYDIHVALSYKKLNKLRQEKFEQCRNVGYTLPSYICSRSVIWPDIQHGQNCFILENQTIQPTVKIGDNVMIWSGNHIGHGTHIGDHTYVSSHVVISGHCRIGQRCFFGVNATLKDFINIGDDCFVTMNSSVIKDVPAGAVTLGAQGMVIEGNDRRSQAIIQKYFG